MGMMALGLLFC